MTLVDEVRGQLSSKCITNRIGKRRCSLNLDRVPTNRLIVDLDKQGAPIGLHEQRCDYLFFAEAVSENDWVAPIELKSGGFNATKVEGQLRSGARAIESLVPRQMRVRLVPIVAGTCRKAERQRLRLRKVIFRGTATRIKLRPCNSPLAAAFDR